MKYLRMEVTAQNIQNCSTTIYTHVVSCCRVKAKRGSATGFSHILSKDTSGQYATQAHVIVEHSQEHTHTHARTHTYAHAHTHTEQNASTHSCKTTLHWLSLLDHHSSTAWFASHTRTVCSYWKLSETGHLILNNNANTKHILLLLLRSITKHTKRLSCQWPQDSRLFLNEIKKRIKTNNIWPPTRIIRGRNYHWPKDWR